jgi:two-component system, NtrC family, nitrogen regulation response regulator NtrX
MERQYKVLIVDDESEIRDVYGTFLTKRGFEVATAVDGADGLEKLHNDQFDVAVVDVRMPRMDGLEMIRQAKAAGVDASFIIITGHGDREDAVAAVNLGVEYWFDKSSIDMAEFAEKVQELAQVFTPEEMNRILSAIPDTE